MNKTIILVTGNAGFIGSHLTTKLLAKNYEVIGIDNFNDYYNPKIKTANIAAFNQNQAFKQFKTDILDLKKLEAIFCAAKPTIIVHLAARAGVRPSLKNPKLYRQTNIQGTKNLLKLAKKYAVKKIIFASSSSVYGEQKKVPFSETDRLLKPVSPYAATKQAGEKLCREFYTQTKIPTVILRFFTVYGPHGRPDMAPYLFTKAIINSQPITRYGDGSTSRDYTYIDDIVSGLMAAIIKPINFSVINLGNNHPVSLNQFISLIEKITSKKAIIKQKPRHPADVPQTYADIKTAKKILGWQPQTDLATGLRKFIAWFKSVKNS